MIDFALETLMDISYGNPVVIYHTGLDHIVTIEYVGGGFLVTNGEVENFHRIGYVREKLPLLLFLGKL